MSLLMFLSDIAVHTERTDDYTVVAHEPNTMDISERVKDTLACKKTYVEVCFSPFERYLPKESKFKEQCVMYFKRNFEKLAEDNPLILPWRIPEDHIEIEGTMDSWCEDTNILSSMKGLVARSFPLTKCLELYGFTEKILRYRLHIKRFSLAPITVVYNPHENAILLVRKAESEKLATDMAISRDDLKMFILLFNDELKGSSVKIIPLVLTDGKSKFDNSQLDCQQCLNHVLSEEEFKTFPSQWKNDYFQTESKGKIKKDFCKKFLAKATSLIAATYIYPKCIPKFTSSNCKEMDSLAVLLTREQMEIYHSQDKHMIIKGGFGCGKTIVAAAMLEKKSKTLLEHEKIFYICYDSRSPLINHMAKGKQESIVAKLIPVLNENGLNLSQIISDILQKENVAKKLNFVIDEYDGEDLDESEAKKLNDIFANNELLKEALIMLIVQPIEKERTLNNIQRKGNMFHLLKTMKTHQLTLVMRNSVEIHKLVAVTKKILSEEKTVYIHQDNNKAYIEGENTQVKSVENAAKRSAVVSKKSLNELIATQKDQQVYLEEKLKMGIDEAQAITGSPAEIGNGENKTVSKFRYAAADEIGHKISFKRPDLFELEDRCEFRKVLSLIAIFEKLDIRNKSQVFLHFDTLSNEIPSTLQFIFEHHFGIHEKVTDNYQEFDSLKKSILVCSFIRFRGVEYPKVTVVIDRDIYFLQHYLAESLARCTSKLTIVVLQNSATLKNVTEEWKRSQLVNQWKTLCDKDTHKKNFVFKKQKDDKIINVTFKDEYYGKLEDRFRGISANKDELKESKMKSYAKKIIEKTRYIFLCNVFFKQKGLQYLYF